MLLLSFERLNLMNSIQWLLCRATFAYYKYSLSYVRGRTFYTTNFKCLKKSFFYKNPENALDFISCFSIFCTHDVTIIFTGLSYFLNVSKGKIDIFGGTGFLEKTSLIGIKIICEFFLLMTIDFIFFLNRNRKLGCTR